MEFKQMIKDSSLIKGLEKIGYKTAMEVQQQCIPQVLQGKDLVARSQTGSGKTLAFIIPIIEMLNKNNKETQALVVCPTRELAMQIVNETRKIVKDIPNVNVLSVCGGSDIRRQIVSLKRGSKIVIGTPGRLIDHIRRRTINLSNLRTVVLDEADEMLNMGFKEDIEKILSTTSRNKQVLLFSATFPNYIKQITKNYQKDATTIEIGVENSSIKNIDQRYFYVKKKQKLDLLSKFIEENKDSKILLFSNTKKMVENISTHLKERGILNVYLHGDLRQNKRKRVMKQVKDGKKNILIATDVAARGIDINDIGYILNYDIPKTSEFFLHRIGRTARAGKSGIALSLVTNNNELKLLKNHERFSKSDIAKSELPVDFEEPTKKENFKTYSSRNRNDKNNGNKRRSGKSRNYNNRRNKK